MYWIEVQKIWGACNSDSKTVFDTYQLHKSLKVMSHTNFYATIKLLKNFNVKIIFIFINDNMSYIPMIIDKIRWIWKKKYVTVNKYF